MAKSLSEEELKMVEAEEREKSRIRRAKIQEKKASATMPERIEEMKSSFNTIINRLQDAITSHPQEYIDEPEIVSILETAASHMESALLHFDKALFGFQVLKDIKRHGGRGFDLSQYELPLSVQDSPLIIN